MTDEYTRHQIRDAIEVWRDSILAAAELGEAEYANVHEGVVRALAAKFLRGGGILTASYFVIAKSARTDLSRVAATLETLELAGELLRGDSGNTWLPIEQDLGGDWYVRWHVANATDQES